MADSFDGVTPDMIRAAEKRAAAVAADRGVAPVTDEPTDRDHAPVANARKKTTR